MSALASKADAGEPVSEQVVIKWHGTEFSVNLANDDTVGSLKRKIEAETEVAPKLQKLLGSMTISWRSLLYVGPFSPTD